MLLPSSVSDGAEAEAVLGTSAVTITNHKNTMTTAQGHDQQK